MIKAAAIKIANAIFPIPFSPLTSNKEVEISTFFIEKNIFIQVEGPKRPVIISKPVIKMKKPKRMHKWWERLTVTKKMGQSIKKHEKTSKKKSKHEKG